MKSIFAKFGIPELVLADNMPFFRYQFKGFSRERKIEIRTRCSHYPQLNGLVEEGIGIAKNVTTKCNLRYRNTNFAFTIKKFTIKVSKL